MPQGKGTYGSKRGRPPASKKMTSSKTGKGSKEMKEKMAKLRAMKKNKNIYINAY
jgi:hypothetical protein